MSPLTTWIFANLALALAYARTVGHYRTGWGQLPEWQLTPGFSPKTKISVLVPCRNEAAKLPACLASIAQQSYPAALFEVILLDDGSEDGSFLLAQGFAERWPNFKAIRLGEADGVVAAQFIGQARKQAVTQDELLETQQDGQPNKLGGHKYCSGKKAALEAGMALASGELIACTDADCEVPPDWLLHFAAFYEEKQAKFIAAPVNFHREAGRLQRFQSLDFLGMMGVTGAGFSVGSGLLCNGANLAYPKAIFREVGGFEGISGLASGDDMLLLHKVAGRYPEGVFFLKNRAATVLTEAQPDLRSFVSQRLRWASKSRSYTDWRVTLRLVVAYLICCAILLNLVLAAWLSWPFLALAAGLFLVKSVVDYRFLGGMAHYFERRELMRGYLLSQWMHIAYIVVVGTLANLVRRYGWKGRRVR